MNWTKHTITLREKEFEASVCRGSLTAIEGSYRLGLAEINPDSDAWFVRRIPSRSLPAAEMLNGVPLYRSESIPQELWRITSCSLEDSIEIARQHFGCPELIHCLHGEASREAIWTFLEQERLNGRIRLSVVTEIVLSFELLPNAERITRSKAQRIMDFCLAQFKEGSSPKERAMMVRGAVETGVFGIGSV